MVFPGGIIRPMDSAHYVSAEEEPSGEQCDGKLRRFPNVDDDAFFTDDVGFQGAFGAENWAAQ